MFKKITLLYLCGLLLTSCSHLERTVDERETATKNTAIDLKDPVPEEFIPGPFHIVAVGDSLTKGVGDSKEQGGYLPYLANLLDNESGVKEVSVQNYGVKGHRTDQLIERLGKPAIREAIGEADMVTVTVGGNDMMKIIRENFLSLELSLFQSEKSAYASRVRKTIELIRSANPDVAIVLIGFYNPFFQWFSNIQEMNDIVDEWNEAGSSVVDEYPNAVFVDIDDLFLDNGESLLFDDNFHPNDRGYQLIAERVYEELGEDSIEVLGEKPYTVRKEESY
ncbi:SGNH/GDSL hydrolase family protein [Mesobacillus foraminis]|uniref:SGNH/GDSL hydrolase family protein n=1 Tax=Mesobacillus foraminis TaxID=279826 RepID=UPI001BEC70F6|nr:SGNH/GDSL hydrolase family protein [Mesobacillus foraminis]MBT2755008.1 SGNH/GDSL hydrolase family protein [Mesobacillus foraminis]